MWPILSWVQSSRERMGVQKTPAGIRPHHRNRNRPWIRHQSNWNRCSVVTAPKTRKGLCVRDIGILEWHGCHPARRGLGSNLCRLGVQRILRHANVSTTATYYIKTAADDVRPAMAKLEQKDQLGTPSGH